MKFIIDAQLPPSLKEIFISRGIECIHTLDLPDKNLTSDTDIRTYCKQNEAILITKDEDFYHTHLLTDSPSYLVLVKVGNCSKNIIKQIISDKLDIIIETIAQERLIIVNR